jgi:hypothetical protein
LLRNKIKDIVFYTDDEFYSSFPSIVRRPDGELLVRAITRLESGRSA